MFINFFFNNLIYVYCDSPLVWQFGTQNPATPSMEGMIFFHNYLMVYLIVITVFVCWMLVQVFNYFDFSKRNRTFVFTHSSLLEIAWTVLPAVALVYIAIPSFTLLYSLDEFTVSQITVRVVGHQWYWSYEYTVPEEWIKGDVKNDELLSKFEFNKELYNVEENSELYSKVTNFGYDSYMKATEDLTFGAFRLLEVDNRVVLPIRRYIRLIITAADVLHSWAVPSFGIKVDACPGRLTEAFLYIKRKGAFYAQCSEICGVNHGFMPIVVRAVGLEKFKQCVASKA